MRNFSCLLTIFFTCLTLTAHAQLPNAEVGLRIGEPLGLSFKHYLNQERTRAYEIILGGAYAGAAYNRYFQNRFDREPVFDNLDYVDHRIRYSVALQFRYIHFEELPPELGRLDGLRWYFGYGAQLRFTNVIYTYSLVSPTGELLFDEDARNVIALGPEGMIGLEYQFQQIPLALFAEIGLMIELLETPFVPRPLFGIGARYNFRIN
jgi:hypothetical protein